MINQTGACVMSLKSAADLRDASRRRRMMKYFEDIQIGDTHASSARIASAPTRSRSFARRFDPQRFHVDEAEAERSHFGKLCASGWHTASCGCGRWWSIAAARPMRGAPAASRSPKIGPSPGFRDLKWIKPVYAGDTISFATEVLEKRAIE